MKFLLMAACLFVTGNAMAQDDAGGELVDVLPAGVTANVKSDRKQDKQKNIVVAGAPGKGYKAFFAAVDDEHGEELWVTDGTKEGTHIVKDLNDGPSGSNPSYLGRFNDKVLFSADAGDGSGQETYISDGTEEGTFLLADTYLFGNGDPKTFTQIDENHAIFSAVTDDSDAYDPDRRNIHVLWLTDGTPEGTYQIAECDMRHPGQDNTTLHTAYVRVGRRVFFKADNMDGTTGEELWVTDGTEEGTYMVMDINWEKYGEGTQGYAEGWTRNCGLDNLENYKNEGVFFQAWTPDYGSEPWFSNGLSKEVINGPGEAGDENTYMIFEQDDTKSDTGIGNGRGTFGTGWEVYDDRIWFRMWDPVGGYEFGGTNMQKGDKKYFDICTTEPSFNHNSYSDPGCVFDGVYMFCASTEFDANNPTCHGGELWCYDGEKVWEQYDLVPGIGCDWVKEQTVAGGSMYWWNEAGADALNASTGALYRLDSKDGIPVVVTHIDSEVGDMCNTLRAMDGNLVFASATTNKIYVYKYRKPGYDGTSDYGYTEPDFGPGTPILGVKDVKAENAQAENNNVYTIDGVQVRKNSTSTEGLAKGVYVVDGKKVVVR